MVHLATHEDHFYDIHRLEFSGYVDVRTDGSCHILSLVEGDAVTVDTEHGTQRFLYAETFVVPGAVGRYRLRSEHGMPLKVVKAYLK